MPVPPVVNTKRAPPSACRASAAAMAVVGHDLVRGVEPRLPAQLDERRP
jgi:hypothetical protein